MSFVFWRCNFAIGIILINASLIFTATSGNAANSLQQDVLNSSQSPLQHTVDVPPRYTVLSGDLAVGVVSAPVTRGSSRPPPLGLEIVRLPPVSTSVTSEGSRPEVTVVGSVPLINSTATFPCGLIALGGRYAFRFKGVDQDEQQLSEEMQVLWPPLNLTLYPEHVATFPEEPVAATLEFAPIACAPAPHNAPQASPEFWLELLFCGETLTGCEHKNLTQVLYRVQVRGYPRTLNFTLDCNLFGLPGLYTLRLRPAMAIDEPVVPAPIEPNHVVKATWSDKYVFNVHARSIIPCDGHGGGISVLFQYPSCILPAGDRVRLYARERADVGSIAPPTRLHYVTEQRVTRGKHSLQFDCDLFVEHYIEYCFVYVSQAITGAFTDVREDCVPTLPVAGSDGSLVRGSHTKGDSGGWSSWSAWTPCSTTCPGGTRNRHRFCDSPPPRYGAKFCPGNSLESSPCGASEASLDVWECVGFSKSLPLPAERPAVKAEVGPGCRCGCIVHLGQAKPRRLLATSSQSCPGRTFWLIQADTKHIVGLTVDHYRLPCENQWLKVRDGDSLSAQLVAVVSGGSTGGMKPSAVISTGPNLLVEFQSDEALTQAVECEGGFLAHAYQMAPRNQNASTVEVGVVPASLSGTGLTAVHGAVALFTTTVILVSACLLGQYLHRYRKYELASAEEEEKSSLGSLADVQVSRSRAASSTTLLSEVISLGRIRRGVKRHARLREEQEEAEIIEADSDENESDQLTSKTRNLERNSLSLSQEMTACLNGLNDLNETTPSASPTICLSMPPTPCGSIKSLALHSEASSSVPNQDIGSTLTRGRAGGRLQQQLQQPLSSSADLQTLRPKLANRRRLSVSITVNGRSSSGLSGCHSVLAKESKDKRNRERLLAGSEFSLAGQESDLEMDYYDYNVSNAGTVPGSFLGMDPAYLVWIPPFAPGCWDRDDSGDQLLGLADVVSEHELHEFPSQREYYTTTLEGSNTQLTEFITPKHLIQSQEDSPVRVHQAHIRASDSIAASARRTRLLSQENEELEKEIRVEKSPTSSGRGSVDKQMFDDEIKFADDDDIDEEIQQRTLATSC